MSNREALARLAAGTVDYDPLPRSQLRPDNLAFLLSGCSKGALHLAMVVDLGMDEEKSALWATAMEELTRRERIMDWMISHKGWLTKLVHLAVFEVTRTGTCDICNGTKERIINKKLVKCNACGGYGRGRITDVDRAERLEITPRVYRYTYRDIYRDVWGWFAARNTEVDMACRENSRR